MLYLVVNEEGLDEDKNLSKLPETPADLVLIRQTDAGVPGVKLPALLKNGGENEATDCKQTTKDSNMRAATLLDFSPFPEPAAHLVPPPRAAIFQVDQGEF
eukprot:763570-Hanusia_phi.AAC.1